jgi:type I restriction enzyme, S subunit
MNAERILETLGRIGDHPATVRQLRTLIVGLAIGGKLGSTDEGANASAIFGKIEQQKRALTQTASRREQAPPPKVDLEGLPKIFANPDRFVRLGSIAQIVKGPTGIMKALPGPYPLVVTGSDRQRCDHFDFDGAAAIVPLVSSAGHGKATLNRLHYQDGKFALGNILAAIFPYAPELVSARFIFEYLTAFKDELLVPRMIGTANVALSVGKLADVPVPLISPTSQAKVDELMALCDRLERARAEREKTRDRLTAARFARLNAPDPETFRDDARFVINALPALTARSDQIKHIRQAILDLAVRGKIVCQNPNDEPASEVLKRIQVRRLRAGIRSRFSPVHATEIPFTLPDGWIWTRIGEICLKTGSGSTPRGGKEVYKNSGIPFLRSQNVYNNGLRLDEVAYIDRNTHDRMSGTKVLPGDLLLNITGGSIGRCCRVPKDFDEANVSQHVAIIRVASSGMESFLHWLVLSPYFQSFIIDEQTGAGRGGLPKNRMDRIVVALPPSAEQRRIIAKLDKVMAICDELEHSRIGWNR